MSLLENFIKPRRLALGLSLRKFAELIGLNASFYSKVERGIVPFPENNDLQSRIANTLNLEESSPEWIEFSVAISLSNGNIPKDVLSDQELAGILPIFFRTIKGGKPSEKDLKSLINFIRKQYAGETVANPVK